MRNKKTWLIIKGGLILLFTIFIFATPTADSFRKWLRFGMLTLFVVSFIFDLNNFKNRKK